MKPLLFACVLAGCMVFPAYGQQAFQRDIQALPRPGAKTLSFEHLSIEQGLSQMTVYAVLQDRKGFMWFGTQSGVNKYDGYDFTTYYPDPDDPNSLAGGFVFALHEDRAGFLWMGTGKGLSRFDPTTETFRRFVHDEDDPESLSENFVPALYEDGQGTLWIGTRGGLNRFNPETESFTRYQYDEGDSTSLSHNSVNALYGDQEGMLWIGTRYGLNRFDPATETFTRFIHERADPNSRRSDNAVSALYEDRQGVLWFGTANGRLHRFDREAETFTRFEIDETDVEIPPVTAIYEDQLGVLWVAHGRRYELSAAGGGLSRFDRETGAFIRYQHDPAEASSLPGTDVQDIYEDRQGVLWIGNGLGGASRVDRLASRFTLYPRDPERAGGLKGTTVRGLYEDRFGDLWVGAVGGVLNRLDRATGTVTTYEHDPADPRSIGPNPQFGFVEDNTGTLWIGGAWLNRYDRATDTFTHYRHDESNPASMSRGGITALHPDRGGQLWIGHAGRRLDRFDPATETFTRYAHDPDDPNSLNTGGIRSIFEDEQGVLWIGGNGLNRFDPATEMFRSYRYDMDDSTSLSSNSIRSISSRPDEPGILWIATIEGGLNRFDTRTERFTRFTVQNSALPDNGIYAALSDEAGRLWLSTNRGIVRFEPETGRVKRFGLDDGLQDLEFNMAAYHKSPSGEMFFGGLGGVNAFFPDQIRDNPVPPQVMLTAFRLFGQPVVSAPEALLTKHISETKALTLAHNQNDLSFDFVGLHYRDPEQNQYAYMLENYDANWREAGTRRTATYTSLPPGDYVLRVKAANSDGVWNEEGTSLAITIHPPWWRTTWAYFFYGVLFVAGVFAVDRVQRRRLIQQERERAHTRELEQAKEIERAYLELRKTKDRLVQQEKMASLGQLTAGIAHEIKNPLNFVNNFAEVNEELADELHELLGDEVAEDVQEVLADLKQNAQVIAQHGKRADGIVHAMMQHASGGTGQREPTEINHLVSEHIDLAYHGKRAQVPSLQVEIERDLGLDVGAVEIVPQEIGRVLLNLLGNAFDAVHEHTSKVDGVYTPTVKVSISHANGQVEIRVGDNGPGISPDIKEKIFEPFFTTKPTGSGTGLGLSLGYDIVTQGHGGTLTVESEEGAGATFIVTLPVNQRAAASST